MNPKLKSLYEKEQKKNKPKDTPYDFIPHQAKPSNSGYKIAIGIAAVAAVPLIVGNVQLSNDLSDKIDESTLRTEFKNKANGPHEEKYLENKNKTILIYKPGTFAEIIKARDKFAEDNHAYAWGWQISKKIKDKEVQCDTPGLLVVRFGAAYKRFFGHKQEINTDALAPYMKQVRKATGTEKPYKHNGK